MIDGFDQKSLPPRFAKKFYSKFVFGVDIQPGDTDL